MGRDGKDQARAGEEQTEEMEWSRNGHDRWVSALLLEGLRLIVERN